MPTVNIPGINPASISYMALPGQIGKIQIGEVGKESAMEESFRKLVDNESGRMGN